MLAAKHSVVASPVRQSRLSRRGRSECPTPNPQAARGLKGTIVKRSGDKTAKVEVRRLVEHPTYKKRIWRNTTLLCHDEDNKGRVGDYVLIRQARPHSRKKHFEIAETLQQARSDSTFVGAGSEGDTDA